LSWISHVHPLGVTTQRNAAEPTPDHASSQ
jgi:hypothetical protein